MIRKGRSVCSTRSNPPSWDVSAASMVSNVRRYGASGAGDAALDAGDADPDPPSDDASS